MVSFQTPTTTNNIGNNYKFENDSVAGISSVVFLVLHQTDGSFIRSEFDINQNQLPRGGMIVSLGSTPGLGYAPLVGAKQRQISQMVQLLMLSALILTEILLVLQQQHMIKSTGIIEFRTIQITT